jgi:segregation and condensation protein A
VGKEDVSVPDMVRYLESILRDMNKGDSVSAAELFERQGSRRAMICLFLAILELVRRQVVVLTQKDAFGEIGLKKHRAFDEALDQSLAAIEQEYT